MMKDGKNKMLKEKDTENKGSFTPKFIRYSPQLDQVVEADNKEEWDKKVQDMIAQNK